MEHWQQHSDQQLKLMWGNKLKQLRVDLNFSQEELAIKTGMSRSSIAAIEKGRNFSIGSLIAILRVFEMLDKIEFFLKEEKPELTPMQLYELQRKKRKRGGYKNEC
jgi:transcriptional regulator with XRE-family HTH domain